MSRTVRKYAPWVIDPVGMALHETTGFDATPGGQVNRALNPPAPRPPAPPTQPQPPKPSIVMRPVSIQPPAAPPAPTADVSPRRPGGGAAATDTTRGLILPGASRSLLAR